MEWDSKKIEKAIDAQEKDGKNMDNTAQVGRVFPGQRPDCLPLLTGVRVLTEADIMIPCIPAFRKHPVPAGPLRHYT